MLAPQKESHDKCRQHIKNQRYHFADKGPYSQNYSFSSSHIRMWDLDIKKAEHQRTDAFETWCWRNSWKAPGKQGIKLVSLKGNQPWIFIGRAKAEAPILWPPHAKSRLIGKDPDAGKDWGYERKGTTEDDIVGLHHWLNGCEFEQTLGDSEGQGNQACCSPWGHKKSDTT